MAGFDYDDRSTPRADLGLALWEYSKDPNFGFIGLDVLPTFNTPKQAANIPVMTREGILADEDVKRKPGGTFNRGSMKQDEVDYKCLEYGYEHKVPLEKRELYKSDFEVDMAASYKCARVLMQKLEKRIADLLFNTSTWTGGTLYTDLTASGSTAWSSSSATPLSDIETGRANLMDQCGVEGNALIMSWTQLQNMVNNTDLKGRIQYTRMAGRKAIIEALKDIFGFDKVLIGKGVYNSANEGQAAIITKLWSENYAMIAQVATEGGSLEEPQIGRTLLWEPMGGAPYTMETYYENQTKSDIFQSAQYSDEKVFDEYLGHLLKVQS